MASSSKRGEARGGAQYKGLLDVLFSWHMVQVSLSHVHCWRSHELSISSSPVNILPLQNERDVDDKFGR